MSQKNWKLLFQEKAFFLNLLESDSGILSRSEALGLLQGDGRRLDALVRSHWVLIIEDRVWPGPALVLASEFPTHPSVSEASTQWEILCQQLWKDVGEMARSQDLDQRSRAGSRVFQHLRSVRSWSFFLHAIVIQNQPEESARIAEAFEVVAARLRQATIRSSQFPAWEAAQWEVIDALEEQARALRVPAAASTDKRVQKLSAMTALTEEQLTQETNLKALVDSGDFLLLHKKLGIVAWPFVPSVEGNATSEPSISSFLVEQKHVQPDQLRERWKASGKHLQAFLEEYAQETALPEEEKLHLFSRILAESGEEIIWEKDATGKRWEVWPGSQ